MELQTPKYNKINNEEADINLCLGLGTDTQLANQQQKIIREKPTLVVIS